MKLVSDERYCLPEENSFVAVTAGKLEVYAVTHRKENFRPMYLMELNAGAAAFPSFDDFEQIRQMRSLRLNWLRLLADKGDDTGREISSRRC